MPSLPNKTKNARRRKAAQAGQVLTSVVFDEIGVHTTKLYCWASQELLDSFPNIIGFNVHSDMDRTMFRTRVFDSQKFLIEINLRRVDKKEAAKLVQESRKLLEKRKKITREKKINRNLNSEWYDGLKSLYKKERKKRSKN